MEGRRMHARRGQFGSRGEDSLWPCCVGGCEAAVSETAARWVVDGSSVIELQGRGDETR